ncbi:MAG TPA: xanthine dehydrogenase family protein subunit M [Acidobacteriota bacterium]|nr:xanthine dehydrogenase family protein subunit M [Acidobacteriota bacterium]
MYLPDVEFHDATTVAEATELMARFAPDARYLAGGTDLLVDLKTGRDKVGHLIAIGRIDALRGVAADASGLRIGALVTAAELAASPVVRERFAPLLDAVRELAAPQIRNMATIGGNITSAVPSADMPPILIAMRASVALQSPTGERFIPLESYFLGPRVSIRAADEIVTALLVPQPPSGFGAAYARFAHRRANSCAVAGVAAGLQLNADGTIGDARVVLGAVAPTPLLAATVRAYLIGRSPDNESFGEAGRLAAAAAAPITDVRGTADFRREIVTVLTRRALAAASQRAKETTS